MIEQVGLAGANERQLVHNARSVRQQIANPSAALAILLKGTPCAEEIDSVAAVHEGESFAIQIALRNRLTIELVQHRLMLEHVKLRRAARHEHVDDPLGASRKVRRLRGERVARDFGMVGRRRA